MSRYSLGTPATTDLSMDNHPNDLLRMPLKEPSDNASSNSSYSPYGYPSELKPAHPTDDKDGSAFANSLIAQSLNADGTPKRPMNAFMIFARKRRPEVSAANQMMRTGEISKILSKEWNAMDISQKQFYLDQAKRLKDTFNSKYPDYVYRRRPNNSRKRRKNDTGVLSMTDPEDLSGGDPSPVEGDGLDNRRPSQYSFNGQNPELSPAGLDEMFPHGNSSTLHSHGSYSGYPYPQSRHQPNNDYPHRPSLQSVPYQHGSSNSHVPSLRSAPLYSPHEQPSLPLSQSHISGNGYQSSQSSHSGYWNDRASGSPHTGGSGYSSTSSTATTTPASSHWSSSMLPPIPSHFPSHNGPRERSYTTTALPTVKSSFPTHGSSPGMLQAQLPLPPLNSVGGGNSSGGGSGVPHRPWSSGPNSQSGGGGNYLPTLTSAFYPPSSGSGPLNSPSSTNTSSGYFPSPPSTTSSTSTGTAGGGDRLLTPPELTYDLPRPAVGEIGVGGNYGWDRK